VAVNGRGYLFRESRGPMEGVLARQWPRHLDARFGARATGVDAFLVARHAAGAGVKTG
jgi:hypothetical protein